MARSVKKTEWQKWCGRAKATDVAFVSHYFEFRNLTSAARHCGLGKDRRDQLRAAQHLIKQPRILSGLDILREETERNVVAPNDVVKQLTRIIFNDVRNLYDENDELLSPSNIDDNTAAALHEIEHGLDSAVVQNDDDDLKDIQAVTYVKKVKTLNKLQAIDQLAKIMGWENLANESGGTGADEIREMAMRLMEFTDGPNTGVTKNNGTKKKN